MSEESSDYKLKNFTRDPKRSAFRSYCSLVYGDKGLWHVVKCELIVLFCGSLPGALGFLLRSKLYPLMFRNVGAKVVFGRNLTLRHAHKIEIGDGSILDDQVVLDAKGESNQGIRIGKQVYIGRNTIVYCKNGDIELGDQVNLSSNCQVFSSNSLTFGPGVVVGAFSYFLSGGEYDLKDETPFAQQSGMCTKGPLTIGRNVWVAAHVSVLDGASIGADCVIGAGAVVNKPIPCNSVAVGVPARVVAPLRETGTSA
jgi:acetyltransferase-like isoleucine patch superfamily enzyme